MKSFIIIVLNPIMALWTGYVLTRLWTWFIVPIFAIRELRIVEAVGLIIFVHLITWTTKISDITAKESSNRLEGTSLTVYVLLKLLYPAYSLLLGYIFSHFVG